MANSDTSIVNRIVVVLVVIGVSLANSALFYFFIWDMLSNGTPYGAILFFVSGGAHLVYFFLPWFIRSMLGPVFERHPEHGSRFAGGADKGVGESPNSFVSICTVFGIGLCLVTLALWTLESEFGARPPENLALITKSNCLQIGGEPQHVNGKLICQVPKANTGSDETVAGNADPSRI